MHYQANRLIAQHLKLFVKIELSERGKQLNVINDGGDEENKHL